MTSYPAGFSGLYAGCMRAVCGLFAEPPHSLYIGVLRKKMPPESVNRLAPLIFNNETKRFIEEAAKRVFTEEVLLAPVKKKTRVGPAWLPGMTRDKDLEKIIQGEDPAAELLKQREKEKEEEKMEQQEEQDLTLQVYDGEGKYVSTPILTKEEIERNNNLVLGTPPPTPKDI